MFNRFTRVARLAVLAAAREAEAGRSPSVTDEHLLLALVDQPGTRSSALLASAGVTSEAVTSAFRTAERKGGLSDAEAAAVLSELGIDVDAVVAQVEASLGERVLVAVPEPRRGRVPFDPTAKDILRGALDQAKSLRDEELRDEHLLLALAAHEGVAGQLLTGRGLGYLEIRAGMTRAG